MVAVRVCSSVHFFSFDYLEGKQEDKDEGSGRVQRGGGAGRVMVSPFSVFYGEKWTDTMGE